MILKVILFISLFFNVSLYLWWMDVWQYRWYVDSTIQDVKDITASEEFQKLQTLIKDKFSETYNQNLGESTLNEKVKEVSDSVTTFWADKAIEEIRQKYPKLSEEQVKELVWAAIEFQNASVKEMSEFTSEEKNP